MKKMILLVLLLAIASITAAQFSMSKSFSVPFLRSEGITAIVAVNDGFVAFGDSKKYVSGKSGEATGIYFDSDRIDTIGYDPGSYSVRKIKNAYVSNGNLVAVGERSLTRISSDRGKTWKGFNSGESDNYTFFFNCGLWWHFISENKAVGIIFPKALTSFCQVSPNTRTTTTEIIHLVPGGVIREGSLFIKVSTDNGVTKSSQFFTKYFKDNINHISEWRKTETLIGIGDSIVSGIVSNDTVYMVSFNANDNSLILSDSSKVLERKTIKLFKGDNLIPTGYQFPDKSIYFFGNDKDGNIFALDLNGDRFDCGQKMAHATCLSGIGDTLLIAGTDNQVVMMANKLFTSIKETKAVKEKLSIIKSGDEFIISSEDVNWTLYSSLGRIIDQGHGKTISASSYTRGMYIIKITKNKKELVGKIII